MPFNYASADRSAALHADLHFDTWALRLGYNNDIITYYATPNHFQYVSHNFVVGFTGDLMRWSKSNENKKITAVVIGCGDRATTYCKEGVVNLKEMEIVAAIDPNPERLRYMQETFGVPAEKCYTHIGDVLCQGKIADCVINGTMDQYHLETSIAFLEQGYDMLLEKPIVNNKKDLLTIRDTVKKNNCKVLYSEYGLPVKMQTSRACITLRWFLRSTFSYHTGSSSLSLAVRPSKPSSL